MPSTRISQFDARRIVGGAQTVSWTNMIENIRDFLVTVPGTLYDVWFEHRASTRTGLDSIVCYIMWYDSSDIADAIVPVYGVEGNDTNLAAPVWFQALTDAAGDTQIGVFLLSADTLPQSSEQNGKLYLYIYADQTVVPASLGLEGGSYVGLATLGIPAGGSALVDIFQSDGTAIGQVPVYNLHPVQAVAVNEQVLVFLDAVTHRLVTIPRCC
jgi:hypothetical protein